MRLLVCFCICFFYCVATFAQQENAAVEQQMESLAEAEETETEDDSYQQQLIALQKTPLNLNTATEGDLLSLRSLTTLQINHFLQYRRLLGKLISFYELQAIPGWDIESINRLRPYVVVGSATTFKESIVKRFSEGNHSLLLRVASVFEKSKGFIADSTGKTKYLGSPQRVYVRYKYQYKNLLQFGLVGDKDAGEQFFKGAQKNGFDFYSIHLFIRNLGNVKRLALGDFTVNFGQGLLTYQSLAFRKSVDVLNIKRQAEVFRPYNSAGEFNFHRGTAITVGNEKWQASAFASYKKVSSNIASDTIASDEYATSILTSGYNRTQNEIDNRNTLSQTAFGGRVQYRASGLQLSVNAVHYQLSKELKRDPLPYNAYTFSGKKLSGVSIDYGYTFRNVHVFGEVASDQKGSLAQIHGLIASVDSRVDVSLLYRHIAKDYNSLYANAFTESNTPINERGLYTGMSVRPWGFLRIDMYADMYSFPWLKYRVDRPSSGSDYLVQLTWKPNKQMEVYTRFKTERKAINYSSMGLAYHQTEDVPRQNWRTNISYKISSAVTVRARAETVWYDKNGGTSENGFLVLGDVFYKPFNALSFNTRLQYFETDGYNSRLYAYENDVLYSYSIPPVFGKGFRTYLNINYDISKHISTWFRIARSSYPNQTIIGSGNDVISANHKTDYRLQIGYNF
jgi:hypothetical protein